MSKLDLDRLQNLVKICHSPVRHVVVHADKELAMLISEVRTLRAALAEACDLAEEGWGYAGDYFCEKWDSEGRLAACRAALPGDTECKGEVQG